MIKIADLVFDLIVENVKKNDFFYKVMRKWAEQCPNFGALEPEKQEEVAYTIFDKHTKIKNSIKPENPVVESFLARYDGEYDSPKYEINDLKDIQRLPVEKIVEFLNEWGGFHLDVNLETDEEGAREAQDAELKAIFDNNGPNYSPQKVETSKAMWYDENSALVNKPNFRVYEVMNEEMSKRFGYYYQSIHKKAWMQLRGNNGVSINNPWCVTWRGRDFSEYPEYDENNVGIGRPLLTHGGNLYGSYRREGRTFFFVIDDNRPELDKYHFSALQKIGRSGWRLTSAFNDGDLNKTWQQVLDIYPELEGEEDKFHDRPLDETELEKGNLLNTINENPGPNEFARQSPARKLQYITLGGYITKLKSWKVMSTGLRDIYIDTMDTANAYQKIRNEEMLNAVLETHRDHLIRRLRMLGHGLSYIVDRIMEQNYTPEYTGQKNHNIRIYMSKDTYNYGIYDVDNNKWLVSNGVKYDCHFEENGSDIITFKNAEGHNESYLVIEYMNPANQMFYTIQVGTGATNDDPVAKVYILTKQQYDSIKEMLYDRPTELNPETDVDLGEEMEKGL